MSAPVLIARTGAVGRIRLNRPKALHALTPDMCAAMLTALADWEAQDPPALVLLDHAEGRGFCAGGDIVQASRDAALARAFFHVEYRLNHLLFTYEAPTLAVLDGVVMGGGVGIGLPCRWRIATERTLFAMPETGIGLFTDVGGGWYLSRLPGRLGEYLALTGARLNGAECHALGLATHYVPSAALPALTEALLARPEAAEALLDEAARDPGPAPILDRRAAIDRLFGGPDLESILAALAAEPGEWAAGLVAQLRGKAPLSAKACLRLVREARTRTDFAAEMEVEYRLATRMSALPDFAEGVRALLVDRDNAPLWRPVTPEAVTPAMLDALFAPLPPDEGWTALPGRAGTAPTDR
ncbi:enoyl-CoA hydratase/isomerase family protein [Sphingomonas morindae]|uniref:3-hydroxyisobutyryl-CoA hydrolase n=1 Tax=Sphingomonas morindae TaxID=1541170 RepID=A0ABY4X7M9_9SPHN|nr:enoyl-CoA hydratase/isomerase family protein [Sphingomonas morindae]USI72943.1 enoyl-CoA hydratase/isomerase family protein [Sphingomonas morindae]